MRSARWASAGQHLVARYHGHAPARESVRDGLDAFVSGLKEKLPLHRLVAAAEAGAAVVFLMANGRMNGETLHIDGGSQLV